jgi:hypothetical protein
MRLSRSGMVSVLLHAVALYGLMRAGWHVPQPVAKRPATVVWLAAPQAAPPPAEPEDRPSAAASTAGPEDGSRAQRPRAPPPRAARATPSPTAAATTAPPAAAPSVAPPPDLVEARGRAAVDALDDDARANARRSFAFPGTIAQQRAFDESERFRRRDQGLQPPLTVFDSPAKGRAALPEPPVVAYGVHWVSDDCYVFREPLDRFILPGLFVPPVTCTRRLARTDLFLTAKPSYLMHDEERAAVDAETQRRELLRRPTTGTVIPLSKD